GVFAAAQLDHDAHAVLVGLVAQLADPLEALLAYELGDLLDQPRLVHLVRQLGDDDRLSSAAVDLLGMRLRAHIDAAAPRRIRAVDALDAVDLPGGREIRPGDMLDQLRDADRRILEQRKARIDDLAEVVRRNIRRHADRDARRAVDQQIWDARRENRGLA